MGLICELYRVNDSLIDDILKDPEWGYNYICEQYAWVSAPNHFPGDTVFSMDKAWNITKALFSKYLATKGVHFDVLGQKANFKYSGSDDLYVVKSKDVEFINSIIKDIEVEEIARYTNEIEVPENNRSQWIKADDYLSCHIQNIKDAYREAALHNQGIVSRIG